MSAALFLTGVLLAAARMLRTLEFCAECAALNVGFKVCRGLLSASVLQTLATIPRAGHWKPRPGDGISSTQTGVLTPARPAFTADESATRALASPEGTEY